MSVMGLPDISGSEENLFSFDTQFNPIPRTAKSEASEYTSTTIQSTSFDSIDKKPHGKITLKKLFSNLTKGNKLDLVDEEAIHPQRSLETLLQITPSPYFKPLEHKLKPRPDPGLRTNGFRFVEAYSPAPTPAIQLRASMYRNSMYEIAKNRLKTARILNGELEPIEMKDTEDAEQFQLRAETDRDLNEDEVNDIIKTLISEQAEQVVASSAKGENEKPAWRKWISEYRKFRYHVNNPPNPPDKHEEFSYLPAVFPGNEVQRRAVCESLETSWVRWSNSQASDIMQTARQVFGTSGASISFFDHDNEIFRIEHGYYRQRVPREDSLAAHALLTHDVFVIINTKNDWRFKNNPLVTGQPNIRFFAAAPMLSKSGHAVGILAVFDTEPRRGFLRPARRQLEDYASAALESMLGNQELQAYDRRSTPILQRDSVINGEYHVVTTDSQYFDGSDNDLRSMMTPRNYNHPQFHGAQRGCGYIEQTPPSTASDDGRHNSRPGAHFSSCEKPSPNSEVNIFPSLQDMITPDSGQFKSSAPRPFSSSDITSLNIQPTNTPRNSLIGPIELQTSNITIEAFLALSDEDCTERLDLDQSDASTVPSSPPLISTSSSLVQTPPSGKANSTLSLILHPEAQYITALPSPTASSDRSQGSSGKSIQAEVAYACHYLAKSLDFDMIYVVEIVPKQPDMSDKDLVAPGGIEKRILGAHGVEKPLDLDTRMHLDVLRTRAGSDYALNNKNYGDEYDIGYLIPLHTELGPLRLRSCGLVVGAFKKLGRDNGGVSRIEEADKLRQEADDLKHVFLKATRLQLQRSPSPNPYPANEAVEIGRSFTSMQPGQSQNSQAYSRSYIPQDRNVSFSSGVRYELRSNQYNLSESSRPPTRQTYRNVDHNRSESRSAGPQHSSSENSRSESKSSRREFSTPQISRPGSRSTQVVSHQCQRY